MSRFVSIYSEKRLGDATWGCRSSVKFRYPIFGDLLKGRNAVILFQHFSRAGWRRPARSPWSPRCVTRLSTCTRKWWRFTLSAFSIQRFLAYDSSFKTSTRYVYSSCLTSFGFCSGFFGHWSSSAREKKGSHPPRVTENHADRNEKLLIFSFF